MRCAPRSLNESQIASLLLNRAPADGGMISGSVKCFPLDGAGCRWWLMVRSRSHVVYPPCRVIAEEPQPAWTIPAYYEQHQRGRGFCDAFGKLILRSGLTLGVSTNHRG